MRRPSTLVISLGITVLFLVLGGAVFYAASQDAAAPSNNTNTAATEGTAGLRVSDDSDNPQAAQKNAAGGDGTDPSGTTQAAASASFNDGLYVVNQNIAPGKYRSSSTGDCSWKRMNALSGYKSTIASAEVNGQTTVDILSTDKAFSSTGCGTWTKQ